MEMILTTLLPLIAKIVPAIAGNSSMVSTVINSMVEITPVLVQEYKDVLPSVKNIIVALKADPTTTQAQLIQLKALDEQVDAAFEAAALAAEAEDDVV